MGGVVNAHLVQIVGGNSQQPGLRGVGQIQNAEVLAGRGNQPRQLGRLVIPDCDGAVGISRCHLIASG